MCRDDADSDSEQQPKKKWYDYKPTKPLSFIAFICLYGIFILADSYEFFDKHHYFSVAAGWVATIALLYEAFHEERLESPGFTFLGLLTTIGAVLLGYCVGPTPGPPPIVGWLQPANNPTPKNDCGQMLRPSDVLFLVGGQGFPVPRSRHKVRAIVLGSCESLTISYKENGMSLDAEIYDKSGKQIGTIIDNKFSLDPDLNVQKDMNSVLVHSKDGTEIIYVSYLNENTILVRGTFYCPRPHPLKLVVTNETTVFDNYPSTQIGGCMRNNDPRGAVVIYQ